MAGLDRCLGLGDLGVVVDDRHVVAVVAVHEAHDHGLGGPAGHQGGVLVKRGANADLLAVEVPALEVVTRAHGVGQVVDDGTLGDAQGADLGAAVGIEGDKDQLGPLGVERHGRLDRRGKVIGLGAGLVGVPARKGVAVELGVFRGHHGIAVGNLAAIDGAAAAGVEGNRVANVVPPGVEVEVAMDLGAKVVQRGEARIGVPAKELVALAHRVGGAGEFIAVRDVVEVEKCLAIGVEELDKVDVLVPLGGERGVRVERGRGGHLGASLGVPAYKDMVFPGRERQVAQGRAFLNLNGGNIAAACRVERDGHELGPLSINRGISGDRR